MTKRREFLTSAAAVTAVAGLAPHRLLAETTGALETSGVLEASGAVLEASDALDANAAGFASGLSRDKFTALLNETFFIHSPDEGRVVAQLVDVQAIEKPVNPEQFSIYFRGPALPALAPSLYEVEHMVAGRTPLYLEPSRAAPEGSEGILYRADLALLR